MSTVTIDSSRFGTLEIASEDVIEFPNGLIGLGGQPLRDRRHRRRRRVQLAALHRRPVAGAAGRQPVALLRRLRRSTCPTRTSEPITADPADVAVWVTVRAGAELADFYANLRAPILVAEGQGHQVINESADAPVRAPLFPAVAAAA